MTISINWGSKVITIPQADLTLVSGALYQLDVDTLRTTLKDLEDTEAGMAADRTHNHNTQVTLSGVIYARTFEIINGYTITFQDVGTPYTVRCIGGNHNIADVKTINQVSLIIGNSAGMIVMETGVSGLTPTESVLLDKIADITTDTVAALNATTIPVDVQKMNNAEVIGDGTTGNSWRGVGVPP